jgi:predicted TIM-barrel fold metal-dependent hydrolase
MIIDSHAHLEPRMLDLDRLVQKMDQAGVDKVALIPSMNDPFPHTPERLLAIARRLMRSRLTRPLAERLHRALLTPEGDLKLGGHVYQLYQRPDNRRVAEALARYPDRFLAWVFLNPRGNPVVLDELEEWRQTPGVVGIKLHPHWHDYRTEALWPVLQRCQELGLPVLVHLGFGPRGDYRAIVQRCPDLTVVCAHAGFPYYDELWEFARGTRNLYVDLSSPYLDEPLVRRAVSVMGPHRCLYGTDSPYGFHEADQSYDYRHILGWVERLHLSSSEAESILGGNARQIFARAGASV